MAPIADSCWAVLLLAADSQALPTPNFGRLLPNFLNGVISGITSGTIISIAIWAAMRSLPRHVVAGIVAAAGVIVTLFVINSRTALVGPGSALVVFVNIALQWSLSFAIATTYLDFRRYGFWYGARALPRSPMLLRPQYGIGDLLVGTALLAMSLAVARLFHHDFMSLYLDSVAARELYFWSMLDLLNIVCSVPVTLALLSATRPLLVVPIGAGILTILTFCHAKLFDWQYDVEFVDSQRSQLFCLAMNFTSVAVHWGLSLVLRCCNCRLAPQQPQFT